MAKGISSINGIPAALLLLLLAAGCRTEPVTADISAGDSGGRGSVSFYLPYSTITDSGEISGIIEDLSFYSFAQGGTFDSELAMSRQVGGDGVTYAGTIRPGMWTVVMATETGSLTAPSGDISTAVMYTMPDTGTECPEIFYGRLDDVTITQDVTSEESASLARNVSKVTVRLTDRNNVVDKNEKVLVQLKEVPTTISWAGTLLPNASNPAVADLPQTDVPTHWPGTGEQYVEQTFILPAHRGSDFGSASPADTLQHRMTICISYCDDASGLTVEKEVQVPRVPVCNGQILYNLIPSGTDVTIVATLLDWNVEDTQEETVSGASSFECHVIPRDGVCEIPIENVYREWNLEGGTFYDQRNMMLQSEEVIAFIVINEDDAIAGVEMVNRAGSWPHAVLKVSSSASTEGDAVVGIRLATDAGDFVRWKWHVIVSDTAELCTESGHGNGMPQYPPAKEQQY